MQVNDTEIEKLGCGNLKCILVKLSCLKCWNDLISVKFVGIKWVLLHNKFIFAKLLDPPGFDTGFFARRGKSQIATL